MKKLIIPVAISAMILGATACQKKFLDLKPEDTLTETQYFKTPEQFKYATNDLYKKMISWQQIDNSNIYDFMDLGSDLSGDFRMVQANYGRGTVVVPTDDIYWNNSYAARSLVPRDDKQHGFVSSNRITERHLLIQHQLMNKTIRKCVLLFARLNFDVNVIKV